MPIYDKPVRFLMKDMAESFSLQPGQPFPRQQAQDWFATNYPKIRPATVTAHLARLSTNAPCRVHHSVKSGEDDLFFQLDGSHFRLYDPRNDPSPIYATDSKPPVDLEEEDGSDVQIGSSEFAYEKDLRNYLAKNLSVIELELNLYEDEDVRGIEFPVGGRFIDILAVDSSDNFVVIELKVSRGYDRVVGQLMRYMAWIQQNLADEGQIVRGIIAAREISNDLLLACSLLSNVQLFEYELSLTMNRVQTPASK